MKSSRSRLFFGFPASFAYLNSFQQWLGFWDPSVHNDNNWRNHTQLLQKVQTDAQEENNALRSGGENFWSGWRCVYIFLVLFKWDIMPLFTIYNISIRCPQNASVRFQLKIPHISFIISFWKCQFWVEAETGCFRACLFKCKWAAASRPVCRIGLCLYRSYLGYSAKNICMVLIIMSIVLKLCVLA